MKQLKTAKPVEIKGKDLPDKVIECCDKLLNEYMSNEQTHRE